VAPVTPTAPAARTPSPEDPAASEVAAAPASPAAPAARTGRAAGPGPLPIRIARTAREDPVQQRVQRGYRAFRDGDLDTAAREYRAALERDTRNRDALLGLGAMAVAGGETARAEAVYLRLLALNPKDRVALAALTALQSAADPVRTESRLKLLLEEDPEAAYLHFALGNAYARQARWPEAQQAYFNAYRVDGENGDYAFNLAVSLDQMGQRKAALDYYRRALDLAAGRQVGFDPAAAQRRVERLSAGRPATPS
jgi:tetratricopeptide (TPR) repeat protein